MGHRAVVFSVTAVRVWGVAVLRLVLLEVVQGLGVRRAVALGRQRGCCRWDRQQRLHSQLSNKATLNILSSTSMPWSWLATSSVNSGAVSLVAERGELRPEQRLPALVVEVDGEHDGEPGAQRLWSAETRLEAQSPPGLHRMLSPDNACVGILHCVGCD